MGLALAAFSVLMAGPGAAKAAEGDLAINETTFPDAVFCSYVSENFDKDHDGFLSEEEIGDVTTIDVTEKEIASLEGIEYFTGLKMLDCKWTDIKSLDVSKNTALEILGCYENDMESLNVSNNPNLKILVCGANCLKSLDVSGSPKLEGLSCEWNELTSLDLSQNTALTILDCKDNNLTELNLGKNTALKELNCSWNKLTGLDVSENTALETLKCVGNKLKDLNLCHNEALARLYCSACGLESLEVSNLPKLSELHCSENKIATLDVSNTPALEILDCYSNKLTKLDVADSKILKHLYCQSNELTELDVSENASLISLDCSYNKLTSLEIGKNPGLIHAMEAGNVSAFFETIEYSVEGDEDAASMLKTDKTVKITGTEYMDIAESTITLPEYRYIYSGDDIEPEPTVVYEGNTLTNGTDYTLVYSGNYVAGTACVVVKGTGKYRGAKRIDFTIYEEEKDVSKSTLTISKTVYAYTGKAITPDVTVKIDDKTLEKDKDYTVSYKNNKEVGSATVTVTGKGDYTGAITGKFSIKQIGFRYRAYVQKKSWMAWSTAKVSGTKPSDMAGTTDNLRMETIQMQLSGVSGAVRYRAYVEKMGWTQWATTADTKTYAGTKGMSRRVEMIQLQASGQVATLYDMYYRAYSEKFGWLGWAKSGEKAGSAGYARKLEAFEVNFVRKGETFSIKSDKAKCFYDKTKDGKD